jgi:serine/threonine-protein kinase
MLYKRAADGTGVDALVLKLPEPGVYEGVWSPDGEWIVLRAGGTVLQAGGRDIMALHVGVDTVPRPLIASPSYDESAIALSPDGRWIAYESDETGSPEVFVRPFPNADGGRWQVSSGGGRSPLWAKSGRELFFVNRTRDMVVVSITSGAAPDIGTPRPLFHLRDEIYLADRENYTPHDIHPDGQRFILARRVQIPGTAVQPIVVVENWFTELRERTRKR